MSDSIGESDLFVELQNRGLTKGLATNIHFTYVRGKFIVHVVTEFNYEDDLRYTIPDFWWRPFNYMVYLDGVHVHKSSFRQMKDENVKRDLEELGVTVDRFRYDRLTKKKIWEIADMVEDRLLELGYSKSLLKRCC